MLRKLIIFLCAILVVSVPTLAWWNSDWESRRIDNVTAPIQNAITYFPYVVNGSDGFDSRWSNILGNCNDFRMVNSTDNGLLNFEFEDKDNSTYGCNASNTIIWALSNISSTYTENYLYYNNSGASDGENRTDIWNALGFDTKAVLHLADLGNDSTDNDNDFTQSGVPTNVSDGKFGGAINVSDANYIVSGSSDLQLADATETMTIEGWLRSDAVAADCIIMYSRADCSGGDCGIQVAVNSGNDTIDFVYLGVTSEFNTMVRPPDAVLDGIDNWHYFVFITNVTNHLVYWDGNLSGNTTYTIAGTTATGSDLCIGDDCGGGTAGCTIILDEIRIHKKRVTYDYINATYQMGIAQKSILGGSESEADTTAPTIEFQTPTPNNQTINITWAFINITMNEEITNATLEWNGTNETMTKSNITCYYLNKTGLTNGNYTFRVWANDTSNNNGTSETRWVKIVNQTTPSYLAFQTPTPNNETLAFGVNWAYIDVISRTNLTNATLEWNGINESMTLYGYTNITQENWTGNRGGGTAGSYKYGQGFYIEDVGGLSPNITQVSIKIYGWDVEGVAWIEIRETNGTLPSLNRIIGTSANVSHNNLPKDYDIWYNFTFSPAVAINSSTLYHIVFNSNTTSNPITTYYMSYTSNLYLKGNLSSTNENETTWQSLSTLDMAFNISFGNNQTRWFVNKTNLGDGNYTFMAWGINLTNKANITSETRWAYIDYANITLCGDASNTSVLNLSYYNEEDVTQKLNASIEIQIITWTASGGIAKNTSFNFRKAENHSICIYPINASVYANISFNYQNNDTHPMRNYYLRSATLSNQTYNFNLFLLETAIADLVKYTIIDYANEPVVKAIMKIQRFIHADNAYITVAMIETDSEGVGIAWLHGNDIFYKYIIEKGETLLADLSPSKIMIDATTGQAELTITADPTTLGAMYDYISDVSYGCSLNTTTNVLRCVLTDSTGMTQTIRLVVDKIEPLLTTNICDNTVTNTAATMTCDLGTSANGTYSYRFYALLDGGGTYMLDGGLLEFTPVNIYGAMGVFFAFLIFMTMMGIGIYDPKMSMALGGGAILVSTAIGFLAIELGLVTGLLAVIAIVIYKMK